MNYEIVESFTQMMREKGIDKDILVSIIEDVFATITRKKFGQDARFDIIVNMDKGDIEIFLEKEIVEKVTDPTTQIDIETVRKLTDEPLEIGDDFVEIVDIKSFGRRLISTARQTLNQKINEVVKELVYNEYTNSIGEIVVGEIYQVRKSEVLIMHNKNELILPRHEQIPREKYRKGETIRVLVKEVKKTSNGAYVIVSRADPKFLAKLFELEIPEIYDGIIEIKAIARDPGERAKIAVESHDDRIDAVGACVGMKGVRIHSIVRELGSENIDVINYSDDPAQFIARALAPAKLKEIKIDKENKKAIVVVSKDQMPLVIGKNGQNIQLASKLVGMDIEVEKEIVEEEYDIDITEFQAELGLPLIERLLEEGYETAKDVIEADVKDLLKIEGLTKQKIKQIKEILSKELEEAEIENEEDEKILLESKSDTNKKENK
ncbi:MAG: Transcription termination protein NusA [Ignavibacteriae bacterium]|nr:MAG: Transcription termination protein NusA [Ignavibacteriota bacterium]